MKLPNFFDFEPLNKLKANMGVPKNVYGDLTVLIDPSRLTESELEKLTSVHGLDISADQLTILLDGTLSYKNTRVLLYIRDVTIYEPRFHLANCTTLQGMRENNRFNRYVVSINTNGYFHINIIENNQIRSEVKRLSVCQNCLKYLVLDGFSSDWSKQKRTNYVANFNMESFFDKYPKTPHLNIPKYNADNAPVNTYTVDFPEISQSFKESLHWKCQQCGVSLEHPDLRKWLHVHHINGIKSDNLKKNLKAVCIRCHADEPSHEHMKSSIDYKEFEKHIAKGVDIVIDQTKTLSFSIKNLTDFVMANGKYKIIDNRAVGGVLWVNAPESPPEPVLKQLKKWDFTYKANRGWWKK